MIALTFLIGLLANFYFLKFFIDLARKNQIVAVGNSKNLHKGLIPRGAGLVFGLIYILILCILFSENLIDKNMFFPIVFGSVSCLILGFLDDLYDLKIAMKFLSQLLIILIIIFYYFEEEFSKFDTLNLFLIILIFTLFLTWVLNAFNFMDGADGHLATVSCMQCFMIFILLTLNGYKALMIPVSLLFLLLLIFLFFNWSPAKVFMGDSGSLFIGINLIVYILIMHKMLKIDLLLILIIFSYFLTDALGTLILRLYLKQNWRTRHRSHPYQNFSNIYKHSLMTKYVIFYHLIWLLPLMLLFLRYSDYQMILFLISFIPSIVFLIKYGPLFSKE